MQDIKEKADSLPNMILTQLSKSTFQKVTKKFRSVSRLFTYIQPKFYQVHHLHHNFCIYFSRETINTFNYS